MKKRLEITATKGSMDTKLIIMEGDVLRIETTFHNIQPRNRKQKKHLKKISSDFKRDGNGTYIMTESCTVNAKVLAMMLEQIKMNNNVE